MPCSFLTFLSLKSISQSLHHWHYLQMSFYAQTHDSVISKMLKPIKQTLSDYAASMSSSLLSLSVNFSTWTNSLFKPLLHTLSALKKVIHSSTQTLTSSMKIKLSLNLFSLNSVSNWLSIKTIFSWRIWRSFTLSVASKSKLWDRSCLILS